MWHLIWNYSDPKLQRYWFISNDTIILATDEKLLCSVAFEQNPMRRKVGDSGSMQSEQNTWQPSTRLKWARWLKDGSLSCLCSMLSNLSIMHGDGSLGGFSWERDSWGGREGQKIIFKKAHHLSIHCFYLFLRECKNSAAVLVCARNES